MPDTSQTLLRFNRLIHDLEHGATNRNAFLPWEVELLLDIDASTAEAEVTSKRWTRYQRAVRRRLERGQEPLKLSEYMARIEERARRMKSRVS